MKPTRFLWVAALVCACTIHTAHAEEPAAAAPKPAHDLTGTLETQERKAWDAIAKRDAPAFLELMSTDGWVIDGNGFTKAANIADLMETYEVQHYALQDLQVLSLAKDVAVLGYTARVDATLRGRPAPAGPWYCTTGYVRNGKGWIARWHQESLATPKEPASGDK